MTKNIDLTKWIYCILFVLDQYLAQQKLKEEEEIGNIMEAQTPVRYVPSSDRRSG